MENTPLFLQELVKANVSPTQHVLKTEDLQYREELTKLYGEEPNHFSD